MSEARVQCYAMLRCCRPPVCGHPDTCFCVPLVARAAAGGAAAAAGGRGGGVSRPGGGGAGEGILTTKSKFMKEIDGRTEIDQAFTLVMLQSISPCTPLPGGEYLPLLPSARRRISPPAPLCQEGVPSLSIKQRGARQARPGRPAAAGFPPHQAAAKTLCILHSSLCSRYLFKQPATSFHP